jgi:hypothetical protein
MVLIKKLNLKNWNDETRLPANIIVVRKEPLGLAGEVGAIINYATEFWGEFWIIMVSGCRYGPFDGVEAAILKWQRDFDFYYIEIKP